MKSASTGDRKSHDFGHPSQTYSNRPRHNAEEPKWNSLQVERVLIRQENHSDMYVIVRRKVLLGQGSSLQDLVSSLFPGHGFPPNCGGGLVHVLDLS